MVSGRVVIAVFYLFFVFVAGDTSSTKQHGEVKYGVRVEHKHHLQKRLAPATDQAFRISLYYDSTLNTEIPSDVRDRIQDNIIPRLTGFLESFLMVRPIGAPILLDRDCVNRTFFPSNESEAIQCAITCEEQTMCGQVEVPPEHLKRCIECNSSSSNCGETGSDGAGVSNADFVLYISARTAGSCPAQQQSTGGSPSTVAFALACQMESDYDRPIAGNVNFCPNAFSGSVTDDFIFIVAKHEILHALAFSTSLFPFWRDDSGNPRTPRDEFGAPPSSNGQLTWSDNTIREVQYNDWETASGSVPHTVHLLVTPAVVAEGRDHFNCPTLEGVELENQGGSGTRLSHWEKRILGNEFMTGIIEDGPVISRFSFALLQDSGWYRVNYSFAEDLFYGREAGCTFASRSCLSYMNEQRQSGESISPFCEEMDPSNLSCSIDQQFLAKCNLQSFSTILPPEYQYFTNNRQGGSELGDFCPTYTSNFVIGGSMRGTDCSNAANQPSDDQNFRGETYGPNSRCFEHGSRWRRNDALSTPFGAGCYETTFDCISGNLTVSVRNTAQDCTPGAVVSFEVEGFTGSIVCPDLSEGFCLDFQSNGTVRSTDPSTTSPTDEVPEGATNLMPSIQAMMIAGLSLVFLWSTLHGSLFV